MPRQLTAKDLEGQPDLPPDPEAAPTAPATVDPWAPMRDQPSPQDRLRDPAFAAFLESQKAQRAQLGAAQAKANQARHYADVGNGFRRAEAAFQGKAPDEAALAARMDAADRPVAQELQKRAADREGLKDFGASQEVQNKLEDRATVRESMDPGSEMSRRAGMLALHQGLISPQDVAGYTASMHQDMLKGATVAQAREQHQAQIAQAQAALKETARHRQSEEQQHGAQLGELKRWHDMQDAEKRALLAMGKPVPTAEAAGLANHTAALKALDELEQLHGKVGPSGYVPLLNVQAQGAYNDAAKAAAPTLAGGLYPNGRGNPAMAAKVIENLPKGYHDDERGKLAFAQMRAMIQANKDAHLAGLRSGPYNPNQVAALEAGVNAAPKAPAPAAPATGVVKVRDKKSGATKTLPAARAAQYLSDANFEQVP